MPQEDYDASPEMHQYYSPPETDIDNIVSSMRSGEGRSDAILDLSLLSREKQNQVFEMLTAPDKNRMH